MGLRYFAGSRRRWHSRLVAWNHGGSEAGASATHCNDAAGNRKQSPLLLRLGEFATPTTSAGDSEIKGHASLTSGTHLKLTCLAVSWQGKKNPGTDVNSVQKFMKEVLNATPLRVDR